jgi:hypothetical protein
VNDARKALEDTRHELTTLHGLYAHDGKPEHTWRLDTSASVAKIDAALKAPNICGVMSASGPEGEPLACAFEAGHDGGHSWASLPTFPTYERRFYDAMNELYWSGCDGDDLFGELRRWLR